MICRWLQLFMSSPLAILLISVCPVTAQILLPTGQPDPAFNSNAMQTWLRADSGVAADQDGRVSDWQDRSNNDNDATQANTDIQPHHATDSFGGREVVNFVGPEAERMFFGTDFESTFQGSFTAFYLIAPEDGQPNGDRIVFGTVSADSSSRMVFGIDRATSMNHLYKVDGSSANTNIAPMPFPDGPQSEFTLISYVNTDGDLHEAFVNGNPVVAGSVNGGGVSNSDFSLSGSNTNAWLGSANNGSGGSWPSSSTRYRGGIAEFILYDGALASSDREAVEGYLLSYSSGQSDPETVFEWTANALGSWNTSNNWNPSFDAPPNNPNHTAIFGSAGAVPTLVAVSDAFTVNRVEFNHTQSYIIGGHGSVSLAATTSDTSVLPTLAVTQGSHEFQAAVNLMADTTATVASDSTLTFNNALNLMGHALTKTGDGTLAINNQLTTAGGVLNVQQGTVSGHGAIGGNVNNDGGTISPGNGASLLKANGVPEPSTILLILVGTLATLMVRIR